MNIPPIENINLIRTHSYPPSSFCTDNGRGNLKGKPVFYCSNNPFAAIFESKPKPNDTGYLSIWKPYVDRDIKIGVFLQKDLRADNEWQITANEAHEFSEKFALDNAKDKYQHLNSLNQFLAEQFVNEKFPYPLTSWLADGMLYGEAWKDLILYPSVTSNSLYCNLAFHPNIVDKFLKFEKVIRFTIDKIDNQKLFVSKIRVGEIIHANIEWRQPRKEETELANFP